MIEEKSLVIDPRRQRVALVCIGAVMALLLARTAYLHLIEKDFLQGQGDARHQRTVEVPAHRGMILDREGEPMAASAPVDSVWANPEELLTARAQWPQLDRLLGVNVARALAGRETREFIYLRRHIDPALAEQVLALGVPGVALQREYRRFYPLGEVGSHIVGFTDVDNAGQEGAELAFDETLRGAPGQRRVIRDRLGRVVEDVEYVRQPKPGGSQRLSIDRRVQYLAYRELKAAVQRNRARAGSVVVMDVESGEVLALVNQPSFNPNNRDELRSDHYRNRALTDIFEPGSTVKPFTVAAALDSHAVSGGVVINTHPGFMRVAGRTVKDLHDYGLVDLTTLIKKSSNVGSAKLSLQTEPEALWNVFAGLGFGGAPSSGFPGETTGQLPHFSGWRDVHRVTLSYGYGLSVTPLQLAQAYAILANGGRRLAPTFVPRQLGESAVGDQVISAMTATRVRAMMESVVKEGGTAVQAAIPGYRVAGKTGTVRKAGAGGYIEDQYLSVFAGLAPASNPRLAMVVMIDEPRGEEYYGGAVAAPVFASVMAGALRLLDIAPDDVSTKGVQLAMAGEHRR
ncbi:MAG: penicillin-binding transpeptidase domain-containing protein [Pseudomonadota bacterium]